MIKINKLNAHVLELKLTGHIVLDDIKQYEAALIPLAESGEHFGVVFHPDGFDKMDHDALKEDVKFESALLGKFVKMGTFAIVTDKKAWSTLAHIMKLLFPMMHVKSFPTAQDHDAQEFVKNSIV